MVPTTGVVGSTVTISVTSTAFPIDGDYQINWSQTGTFDNPNDLILLAKGTTPKNGYSISATFTVPESRYGAHPIQITRYGSEDVYSPPPFNVKPQIVVDPPSASPGTAVIIKGTGFPAKDQGSILFDGSDPGIPFTSNDVGSFTVSYTIPNIVAGSQHTFVANSPHLFATTTTAILNVLPCIKANPDHPQPGDNVTITGSGFAGINPVEVDYNGSQVTNSVMTDKNGNFAFAFVISNSSQKDQKIVATDKSGNNASLSFQINIIPVTPNTDNSTTVVTTNTTTIIQIIQPPVQTLQKPEIISPKDKDQTFGFTGTEPVLFAWKPVGSSSNVTYTLEIADSLDFFPLLAGMEKTGITDTYCSVTIQPGTYFWRVQAVDTNGNLSDWSTSPNYFKVGVIPFWYLPVGGLVVLGIFAVLLIAFLKRLREYLHKGQN